MTRIRLSWMLVAGVLALLAPAARAAADTPASAAAAAPVARPTDALRLIELWLDAQRAYDRVPTVAAGVVIGQELVWSRGFGHLDAAGRVPAAADTIYSICSISKLFTSIAVMQLWEAGKLSLDDDVARHVPAFAIRRTDPDSGPITIRSLLMHAGGLPREAAASYWTDLRFPSRDELFERLQHQSTPLRVHDRQQYSNLGMAILGEVVAATSGMPYAQYVERQVLAPLGLHDTRPRLPTELTGQRLPVGYGPLDRDGRRQALAPFDTAGLVAAAGFSSTVQDLARFASWQLRLLRQGGHEVLRASTLREMQRVQWQDADGKNTWGLGFAVSRDGAQVLVSHAGLCPGYRSSWVLVAKEGFAVVSMTNSIGAEAAPYARQIRQLLNKGWKVVAAKDAQPMSPYVGRYEHGYAGSERVIVPWGDGLAMLNMPTLDPAGDLAVLRRVGGDRFRFVLEDGTLGAELLFERDARGEVVAATIWSQRSRRLGALP